MIDVLAVILGGGRGTRLYPLTRYRSKPAVPIGGKFRLIDIPISNCLHWDIKKIMILTQFNTTSLHRHIYNTYRFDAFSGGFLQILAAQQTMEVSDWYQGTADAVRKNLSFIKNQKIKYVVILSGDQLYRIQLKDFLEFHQMNHADISIAVKPVNRENASQFGILQIDDQRRIFRFVEKPQDEAVLDELYTPTDYLGLVEEKLNYIASMGIYIFNKDALIEILESSDKEDFGRQVIIDALDTHRVYGYVFTDYWEDIGTIEAFFEANLDFANPVPKFNFYDEEFPIYTRKRFLPGSKIENCDVHYSLISDGAIIEGSRLSNTLIGNRSVIRNQTYLERVVMMGADFYETPKEIKENLELGRPPVGVGHGCVIKNAILDKNVRIGSGVQITNKDAVRALSTSTVEIVDGIVVIPKDTVLPDGFVI